MTGDADWRLAEQTRKRRGARRSRGVMPRARRVHRRLNAGVSLRAALGAVVAAVAAGCGLPGLSAHAGPAGGGPSPVVAATFDGHGWRPVKPAARLLNLVTGRQNAELFSVACPGAGACFAAGSVNRRSDGRLVTAFVMRVKRGRWSAAQRLSGDAVKPGALSCASVSLCVTAGSTATYVLDGGAWKRGPAFGTVACAAPAFCIGVKSTPYQYQTFHRSGWTTPRPIAPLPGTNLLPNRLACASPRFCLGMNYGYAYWTFDGTRWTPGRRTGFPLGSHWLDPASLSCASPHFCVVVGGNVPGDAMASTYNGHTWSTPAPVVKRRGYTRLTSVSCPTPRFCAAVGTWSWPTREFAVTLEAGRWSSPAPLADPQGDPSVACAAAIYCLALTGEVTP